MKVQITLIGAAALSGCAAFSPGLDVMQAPTIDSPTSWQAGETAPAAAEGDWLGQFNDPVMTNLVLESLEANPSLRATGLQIVAAEAIADSTRGRTRPSLSAGADAGWVSNVVDVNDEAIRTEGANFGTNVSARWEADVWGRLSAGIAATEADLDAARSDYDAARLSLAAQTASSWVSLNEAIAQEALAQETLEVRQRTLQLTERRFERGLTGALDVRTSRSAVASAQSTIAFRKQATGEARRRIEVLLGRYPAAELRSEGFIPPLRELEGGGDPLSLLARRPDVFAAEARIAAAGFRVDQARLALRPSFVLTGLLSTQNMDLEDALDPAFLAASAVSSITAPLYQGGALKADVRAAEARAEIASATYVQTVLTAWREVEDAIAADGFLFEREQADRASVEEAELAEALAERQYQNGLTSIFNLIDAQTRRLNAESSLITTRAARVNNRIQYHLALGGGVPDVPDEPDLESEQ